MKFSSMAGSFQNDNFRRNQLWKFRQNVDISVLMNNVDFYQII